MLKGAAVYAVLLGWSLWIGFPLYWLLPAAMRRPQDVMLAGLAFANSVFVSVGSACLALVLGAMAGYGLARFTYRIGPLTNERIRLGFLGQRLFPIAVLAVPYLLMFRTLDLLDSPVGILVGEVGFGTPFL